MEQERELHELKMQNERESQELRRIEHELKMQCLKKMIDAIEVVLNDCCGINIKGIIGNFHFHKGNNIVFQNYFNYRTKFNKAFETSALASTYGYGGIRQWDMG